MAIPGKARDAPSRLSTPGFAHRPILGGLAGGWKPRERMHKPILMNEKASRTAGLHQARGRLMRADSIGHERDEVAELAIAEVEPEPRDDADDDRHEEHPVPGVDVGRHRAAQVGEHEQAAEVASPRDEIEDEQ